MKVNTQFGLCVVQIWIPTFFRCNIRMMWSLIHGNERKMDSLKVLDVRDTASEVLNGVFFVELHFFLNVSSQPTVCRS